MKPRALITAAGMGKRFGALTRKTNKCLFQVEGKPLLLHLLDRLKACGVGPAWVVTGYQHAELAKAVGNRANLALNPFYAVSGILGSFWAARRELEGKPFVFTTSDHFFRVEVLRDCLRVKKDFVIVVQKKKAYTAEDAKVRIKDFRVVEMGKGLPVRSADGEFGGMVSFSARGSKLFFRELSAHLEKGGIHGYMMEILLLASRKHSVPIHYSVCGEGSRTEVDSVHDLVEARKLARTFDKRRGKK